MEYKLKINKTQIGEFFMNKYEFVVDKSGKLSDTLYLFGLKPSQVNKLFKLKDVRLDNVKQSKDLPVSIGQKVSFFIEK